MISTHQKVRISQPESNRCISLTINGDKYCIKYPDVLITALTLIDPFYEKYDKPEAENVEEAISRANKGMGTRIQIKGPEKKLNDEEIEARNRKIENLREKIKDKEPGDLIKTVETQWDKWKDKKKRGIGFVQLTKVLHKLFPRKCPMVDNSIAEQLYGTSSEECLQKIYDDFEKNEKEEKIKNVKSQLPEELQKHLTPLRIFDILLWLIAKWKKKEDNKSVFNNIVQCVSQ